MDRLTDRELEFLHLACSEMTYKEIAVEMYLSVHSIHGYVERLTEKLNVKGRIGLVLYAVRNHICQLEPS